MDRGKLEVNIFIANLLTLSTLSVLVTFPPPHTGIPYIIMTFLKNKNYSTVFELHVGELVLRFLILHPTL